LPIATHFPTGSSFFSRDAGVRGLKSALKQTPNNQHKSVRFIGQGMVPERSGKYNPLKSHLIYDRLVNTQNIDEAKYCCIIFLEDALLLTFDSLIGRGRLEPKNKNKWVGYHAMIEQSSDIQQVKDYGVDIFGAYKKAKKALEGASSTETKGMIEKLKPPRSSIDKDRGVIKRLSDSHYTPGLWWFFS
jgi:hypothetical protein